MGLIMIENKASKKIVDPIILQFRRLWDMVH